MKLRTSFFSVLLVLSAIIAFFYAPKPQKFDRALNLASLVPERFQNWHSIPDVQMVTAQDPNSLERELYSEVLTRAYADNDNHIVMLLLAYGPSQTDRLQLHRPEICYVANGFQINNITRATIEISTSKLAVRRLLATRAERSEYITYWMRIGNKISNSVFDRQLIKLEYGLKGIIPDGLLVRTSVVGSSGPAAYLVQDQFVKDLAMSSPRRLQAQLFGYHVQRSLGSEL